MVLVFVEHQQGVFKKAAFEAVYYAYQTAQRLQTQAIALTFGNVGEAANVLGTYGAVRVLNVAGISHLDSQVYTKVITEVAHLVGATTVVLSHDSTGKTILGGLSVRLQAGSVSAATSLPTVQPNGLLLTKNVFSGKAVAHCVIQTPKRVISISPNTFPPKPVGNPVTLEALNIAVPNSRVTVVAVDKVQGKIPLTEAERVVSAGRGLKAPENWGIIESLADALNATTACSRPVADAHWRPHHEHVGQTGVAIKPNLYFAIGISGAIQHLAGVNQSKTIVVINKDPEAPFFKAADYGVIGDLFEIVPKLTEAIHRLKA